MSLSSLNGRKGTQTEERAFAYRLVGLQMLVVLLVSMGWAWMSWRCAFSALLGGCAVVLPSLYMARRLFTATHARQVKRILRALYWGELIKLLLTAALVIVIIRSYPVAMLPFFSGFVCAQFGVWLAPLAMRKTLF